MEEKNVKLLLENRSTLSLTGVLEICSFQEEAAAFETSAGLLQITGTGMHMEKLDLETGSVILTGKIVSLYYPQEESAEASSLWRRLFRS